MFELVPALGDHYVTNVIVPPAFSSFSEWVSEARTWTRQSNDRTWIRKNTISLHASTSRLTFSNLEQNQDYVLIFSNVAINADKKIALSP